MVHHHHAAPPAPAAYTQFNLSGVASPLTTGSTTLTAITSLTLSDGYKPILTVHPDGSVAIAKGISPDDASKCFWNMAEAEMGQPGPFPNVAACPNIATRAPTPTTEQLYVQCDKTLKEMDPAILWQRQRITDLEACLANVRSAYGLARKNAALAECPN